MTPVASSPIKVEPFHIHIVNVPKRRLNSLQKKINHELKYGPPYQSNELLEQVFLEELSYRNPSLLSIHECLAAKVDPNIKNEKDCKNRPLHYAARHGNITLAKMLLRAGAQIHLKNTYGQTPLLIASRGAKEKHADFLLLMLLNGGDVNDMDRGGNTPLECAVRTSNIWSVNELLANGANVTTNDRYRVTATCGMKKNSILQIAKNIALHDLDEKSIKIESCPNFFAHNFNKKLNFVHQVKRPSSLIVDMLEQSLLQNFVGFSRKRRKKKLLKRVNTIGYMLRAHFACVYE